MNIVNLGGRKKDQKAEIESNRFVDDGSKVNNYVDPRDHTVTTWRNPDVKPHGYKEKIKRLSQLVRKARRKNR